MTLIAHVRAETISFCGDPFALFEALGGDAPDTILLESRDGNGQNNVRSMLFIECCLRMETRGNQVTLIPLSADGEAAALAISRRLIDEAQVRQEGPLTILDFDSENREDDTDLDRILSPGPLDALRVMSTGWQIEGGGRPEEILIPGVFSYDMVENFEKLPPARSEGLGFPDGVHWLPRFRVVIDHTQKTATVCAIAYGTRTSDPEIQEEDLGRLVARTRQAVESLAAREQADSSVTDAPGNTSVPAKLRVDMEDGEYRDLVCTMKAHIVAGDVFQIVPSRTFSVPCAFPLRAYDVLRRLNPSPYLFVVNHPNLVLFGSSPETCVRVSPGADTVELRPIAGTRPRGLDPTGRPDAELDMRMEADLRLNHKETAEHMMLVDLARNDVARICRPGTRRVNQLLAVERYSHVMHLVSSVSGTLDPRFDALHAYRASANMGTLVGAPKIEACVLLRKYERDRRGPYGGAVGYLSSNGAMDTAIVIRCAAVVDGIAHVRAGAGVVYDSDPDEEARETWAKAAAVLRAVTMSEEVSR